MTRLHETQLDLGELGHELQQEGDGIAAGNHGEQDLHGALHLRLTVYACACIHIYVYTVNL